MDLIKGVTQMVSFFEGKSGFKNVVSDRFPTWNINKTVEIKRINIV